MIDNPSVSMGCLNGVTVEGLWHRFKYFISEVIPVAGEARLSLAAHPDDPPLPELRNTRGVIYRPDHYDRLLNVRPGKGNAPECCRGTIVEMKEGDKGIMKVWRILKQK